MTPQKDHFDLGRHFEQPEGRFGSNHLVRDEIPAINPEIIDMLERQETAEANFLSRMAARRGAIAVADTVSVSPGSKTKSSYETPTGLYL